MFTEKMIIVGGMGLAIKGMIVLMDLCFIAPEVVYQVITK